MKILQTPTFCKQIKKLHKNQKVEIDLVVEFISRNTLIGEMKKGDLNGFRVYKFKMINQLTLLAYQFDADEQQLVLHLLGFHENFYRDLKK